MEQMKQDSEYEGKSDKQETEDLLPEYCAYRDEGCELAASCLDCPFPECIYDSHWGSKKRRNALRDQEIVRLFTVKKKTQTEIAKIYRISLRSIRRILLQARKLKGPGK
jgi:hypothetical protein